jgi:hypothetical protein
VLSRMANDHELPHKMYVAPFCLFVCLFVCFLLCWMFLERLIAHLNRVARYYTSPAETSERGFFKVHTVQPEGSHTNPTEG